MDHKDWQATIFRQLADCESKAREQQLLAALAAHRATPNEIEEMRRSLREAGTMKGKAPAEARIWADDILRRLVALLDLD